MSDGQYGYIVGSLTTLGICAFLYGVHTSDTTFIGLGLILYGLSYAGPLNGHPRKRNQP